MEEIGVTHKVTITQSGVKISTLTTCALCKTSNSVYWKKVEEGLFLCKTCLSNSSPDCTECKNNNLDASCKTCNVIKNKNSPTTEVCQMCGLGKYKLIPLSTGETVCKNCYSGDSESDPDIKEDQLLILPDIKVRLWDRYCQ